MDGCNDGEVITTQPQRDERNELGAHMSRVTVDAVNNVVQVSDSLAQPPQSLPPQSDAFSPDSRIVNELSENNNVLVNEDTSSLSEKQREHSEALEEATKQTHSISAEATDDRREEKYILQTDPFEAADAAIREMDEDVAEKARDSNARDSEVHGAGEAQNPEEPNDISAVDGSDPVDVNDAASLETVLKTDQIPEAPAIPRPAEDEFEAKNKRTGRTFPMPTMNLLDEIVYFPDAATDPQDGNKDSEAQGSRSLADEIDELAFRSNEGKDDAVMQEIRALLQKPGKNAPSSEMNNAQTSSESNGNDNGSSTEHDLSNTTESKTLPDASSDQMSVDPFDHGTPTDEIAVEEKGEGTELSTSESNETTVATDESNIRDQSCESEAVPTDGVPVPGSDEATHERGSADDEPMSMTVGPISCASDDRKPDDDGAVQAHEGTDHEGGLEEGMNPERKPGGNKTAESAIEPSDPIDSSSESQSHAAVSEENEQSALQGSQSAECVKKENFEDVFDSYMSNHECVKMMMADLKGDKTRGIDSVQNKGELETSDQRDVEPRCVVPEAAEVDQSCVPPTVPQPDSESVIPTNELDDPNGSHSIAAEHSTDANNMMSEGGLLKEETVSEELMEPSDSHEMESLLHAENASGNEHEVSSTNILGSQAGPGQKEGEVIDSKNAIDDQQDIENTSNCDAVLPRDVACQPLGEMPSAQKVVTFAEENATASNGLTDVIPKEDEYVPQDPQSPPEMVQDHPVENANADMNSESELGEPEPQQKIEDGKQDVAEVTAASMGIVPEQIPDVQELAPHPQPQLEPDTTCPEDVMNVGKNNEAAEVFDAKENLASSECVDRNAHDGTAEVHEISEAVKTFQSDNQPGVKEVPTSAEKTRVGVKQGQMGAKQSGVSIKPQGPLTAATRPDQKPSNVARKQSEKLVGDKTLISKTRTSTVESRIGVSAKGTALKSASKASTILSSTERVSQRTQKPPTGTTSTKAPVSVLHMGMASKTSKSSVTSRESVKSKSAVKSMESAGKMRSVDARARQSPPKREEGSKEPKESPAAKQATMSVDHAGSAPEERNEEHPPKPPVKPASREPIEWIESLVPAFESMWAVCFTQDIPGTHEVSKSSEGIVASKVSERNSEENETNGEEETQALPDESRNEQDNSEALQEIICSQTDGPISSPHEDSQLCGSGMSLKDELAQTMQFDPESSSKEEGMIAEDVISSEEVKASLQVDEKFDSLEEPSSSHSVETPVMEPERVVAETSHFAEETNSTNEKSDSPQIVAATTEEISLPDGVSQEEIANELITTEKDSLTTIPGSNAPESVALTDKPTIESTSSPPVDAAPQPKLEQTPIVDAVTANEGVQLERSDPFELTSEQATVLGAESITETIAKDISVEKADSNQHSEEVVVNALPSMPGPEECPREEQATETAKQEASENDSRPRQHGRGQFRGSMMSEQENWKPSGRKQKNGRKQGSRETTPGSEDLPQSTSQRKSKRRGKRSGKGHK